MSKNLRSVKEIRDEIDQYIFDNYQATLRNSKLLQELARELAFALHRENSTNVLQRDEMIRYIDQELASQTIH